MALFSRTPRPSAALVRSLGGRRALALASSDAGEVAGTADRLFFPDGVTWAIQPWHEVERGGFDGESRTLSWTTTRGEQFALQLTEPRGLPDLFNERVTASIAATRVLQLGGRRTAVISARRGLADPSAKLVWRVTPGRGVTAAELAGDPLVELELERVRAEYDVG